MKDLIGKQIGLVVANVGTVKGLLVGEEASLILLRDAKGIVNRIPKGMICLIRPLEDAQPIFVLACQNTGTKCNGIRYLKLQPADQEFGDKDYDEFMNDCPCRSTTCQCGSLGDLALLPRDQIMPFLDQVMLGDYPAVPVPIVAKEAKAKAKARK